MTLPRTAALAVLATLAGAAFFCWPEPPELVTKHGYPAAETPEALAVAVAAWESEDPDSLAALQCTHAFHWLPGGEPVDVMEWGPRDLIRVYIYRTRAFIWCNAEAITTHKPDEP